MRKRKNNKKHLKIKRKSKSTKRKKEGKKINKTDKSHKRKRGFSKQHSNNHYQLHFSFFILSVPENSLKSAEELKKLKSKTKHVHRMFLPALLLALLPTIIASFDGTLCNNSTKKCIPNTKGRRVLEQRQNKALFTAVYWELKPYIYMNEDGELDGLYPQIFANAMNHCGPGRNATPFNLYNATKLIDFKSFRQTSRRAFMELFKSKSYPPGLVPGRDIYVPVIYRRDRQMLEVEKKKSFLNFDIEKAENLAVIVHRDYISLPNKVYRGVTSCGQIFLLSLFMTLFFGISIWLAERVNNPAFPDSCLTGTGAGVWWSFVSMTTVGYGDIVPNSLVGRFIAVIWVCIGVMIACIITATVTEVVNGVGDLDIAGKKVAVLENSIDAERTRSDFRAIPYELPSYEEVYASVRRGDVYAAAVNAEVAAWNIDEITDDENEQPLRIVKLLPTRINLNMVFSTLIPEDIKPVIRCMHLFKTEVYDRAKIKVGRYCSTETLYIGSLSELFKSAFVQILLGAIFLLFIIGVTLDIFHKRKILRMPQRNGLDEFVT